MQGQFKHQKSLGGSSRRPEVGLVGQNVVQLIGRALCSLNRLGLGNVYSLGQKKFGRVVVSASNVEHSAEQKHRQAENFLG